MEADLGKVYTQTIREVFALAGTSKKGLSPNEARLRLKRFGPNVLSKGVRLKLYAFFYLSSKTFLLFF